VTNVAWIVVWPCPTPVMRPVVSIVAVAVLVDQGTKIIP
jgi:hypothetical protein